MKYSTVSIDQIAHLHRDVDFCIRKLNFKINIDQLKDALKKTHTKYKLIQKDGNSRYFGISLQFNDPENPLYDGVNEVLRMRGSGDVKKIRPLVFFETLNEVARVFDFVFEKLNELPLTRGRILEAEPGLVTPSHVDGPMSIRLHIPVETSPDAVIVVDGVRYHLPADGSIYLVNTERPHYIENFSTAPRAHLVFNVSFLKNSRLSQVALERFLFTAFPKERLLEFHQICYLVKERDQFRCRSCGVRESVDFSSPPLHVHQITNGREFDTKEKWEIHELVTLCELCHFGEKGFHNLYGSSKDAKKDFHNWLK